MKLDRLLAIIMLFFFLGVIFGHILGCATVPIRAFNAEDKQDGHCYATLGGELGYCNETR